MRSCAKAWRWSAIRRDLVDGGAFFAAVAAGGCGVGTAAVSGAAADDAPCA